MQEEEEEAAGEVAAADEAHVWNRYVCRSIRFGSPHPGDIVEPASLAAVNLPRLEFPLLDSLGKRVDKLSRLQLEGVGFACQKHQQILPNGQRAGFFIGDGAGVGKGRQIAGILFDNLCRGRPRHLWVSTSGDLYADAKRDLADLGCTATVHDGVRALDRFGAKGLGLSRAQRRGVLFTTYTSLVSGSGARFAQICRWIGDPESFCGCLVFDECHKAKNFGRADKEDSGSKVARAVINLQQTFPKARCVYVSATGVTDISNMAYMERLGLWGEGAPFRTFEEFRLSMGKRNLGALEMLAMELKCTGMHVSRGLSYHRATFETLDAELSEAQHQCYLSAASFWLRLYQAFEQAGRALEVKVVWGPFWSAHQRFFKQLCVALKVPTIVRLAREALAEGKCVVLGVQTTAEAALHYWAANFGGEAASLPGSVSPCFTNNLLLMQLISNHFPRPSAAAAALASTEAPAAQAPQAGDRTRAKVAEAAKLRDAMLDEARNLPLPPSALDDIIYRLGGRSAVAEMTGRRTVLEGPARLGLGESEQADGGLELVADTVQVVSRTGEGADLDDGGEADTLNAKEKAAFMAGDKLVAIISDAASTGISLHADLRVANQRKRVHITCELPWAADAAVQQLGRSHRSSQAHAPDYKLLASGVGGENRFVSAVAARLQSLGALTHGDRRASSGGVSLGDFNFSTKYGTRALRQMLSAACAGQVAHGVDYGAVLAQTRSQLDCAFRAQRNSGGAGGYWSGALAVNTREDFVESTSLAVRVALADAVFQPGYEAPGRATTAAAITTRFMLNNLDRISVVKFLNRCLGLSIHLQGLLFNYYGATLDAEILRAKAEGTFDEGVSDLRAGTVRRVGAPRTIYTNAFSGGQVSLHMLEADRGLSFPQALAELERRIHESGEPIPGRLPETEFGPVTFASYMDVLEAQCKEANCGGFYLSRARSALGGRMVLLALRKGAYSFHVLRPNTGHALGSRQKDQLEASYTPSRFAAAQAEWDSIYAHTEHGCTHGGTCKAGPDCTAGKRLLSEAVISGCVVPLWNQLADVLRSYALGLPEARRVLRIVRVQLHDGERIVGIRWPPEAAELLVETMRRLRDPWRKVTLSWADVVFSKCAEGNPGFTLLPDMSVANVGHFAAKAGLKAGDVLGAVNGNDVPKGATLACVWAQARTIKEGEQLVLTVGDKEALAARDVQIELEPPTPVNPAAAEAAVRERKTIKSFFAGKAAPAPGGKREREGGPEEEEEEAIPGVSVLAAKVDSKPSEPNKVKRLRKQKRGILGFLRPAAINAAGERVALDLTNAKAGPPEVIAIDDD